MTPREECYDRIRRTMKETLKHYYERHPDRLFDERGNEAVKISLQGLETIFKILNEYELARPAGPVNTELGKPEEQT